MAVLQDYLNKKGLTYLLDAISLISDENLCLFIVGDGELRAELEKQG